MFDTKQEDVKRLIATQYLLIAVETPVGIYLTYKFPAFNIGILFGVVILILVTTLILHLFVILKVSKILQDIALIILATTVIATLTAVMHYIPSIRPALVLMYIPSVIFAASQCLSFGVISAGIMVIFFTALTGAEYFNFHPLFKSGVDLKALGATWQISNLFSFFFLIILAFMSNYFFEMLRRREKKIQHLAELNKKLYQKSKTTSDEIFKKMDEALVVFDKSFNIVQYNIAFKNMVSSQTDLINRNISTLPFDFCDEIKKYIKEAEENQSKSIQFKTVDASKHNYTIRISLLELAKNEHGYIVLINKHALPWGTVFDSLTKKPIDLVLVRLMNGTDKRVIETKVTDREGRFGFIVPAGKYYIFVSKEGFEFPSRKSKQGYRGEQITINSDSEGIIKIDVPLDMAGSSKSK